MRARSRTKIVTVGLVEPHRGGSRRLLLPESSRTEVAHAEGRLVLKSGLGRTFLEGVGRRVTLVGDNTSTQLWVGQSIVDGRTDETQAQFFGAAFLLHVTYFRPGRPTADDLMIDALYEGWAASTGMEGGGAGG